MPDDSWPPRHPHATAPRERRGRAASAPALARRLKSPAVFIAHSRALPEGAELQGRFVWTSGSKSWFALAAQGVARQALLRPW